MSSISEFYSKQLTDDLTWREAELAVIRKYLAQTTKGSAQEEVLLRAATTMLYAHYEGYCKFALNTYIDALEKMQLKIEQTSWPLATLALASLRRKASDQTELKDFFSVLFSGFNLTLTEIARYERPKQISNLWPDVLLSWTQKLDLGCLFVEQESTLLESLVNNRNQIAHGKKLIISDREEIDKYFHSATLAMHDVAVSIVESLENRTYLKCTNDTTIMNHSQT